MPLAKQSVVFEEILIILLKNWTNFLYAHWSEASQEFATLSLPGSYQF